MLQLKIANFHIYLYHSYWPGWPITKKYSSLLPVMATHQSGLGIAICLLKLT